MIAVCIPHRPLPGDTLDPLHGQPARWGCLKPPIHAQVMDHLVREPDWLLDVDFRQALLGSDGVWAQDRRACS